MVYKELVFWSIQRIPLGATNRHDEEPGGWSMTLYAHDRVYPETPGLNDMLNPRCALCSSSFYLDPAVFQPSGYMEPHSSQHQHQSINGFGKDLATNMWGKWTHHICSSHWLISSPQSTTVQCALAKNIAPATSTDAGTAVDSPGKIHRSDLHVWLSPGE